MERFSPDRPLVAKSYKASGQALPPSNICLEGHGELVTAAALAIYEKVGKTMLEQAELTGYENKLQTCLILFGWLHDIGKGNLQWYDLVVRRSSTLRGPLFRHEVVSGIILCRPELKPWIEAFGESIALPVLWAILGHHRKMDGQLTPQVSVDMVVPLTHPDFSTIFQRVSSRLGIEPPRPFAKDLVLTVNENEPDFTNDVSGRTFCDAFEASRNLKQTVRPKHSPDEKVLRFAALVKATAISADVLASAMSRYEKDELVRWLSSEAFLPGVSDGDLEQVIRNYIGDRTWEPRFFQQETARLAAEGNTLVLVEAGCGSGKSVAAYMWAREWCRRLGRRTMFFTLPTTGTTTEHFRGYALHSGIDSSLIHSRAEVDLERLKEENPENKEDENDWLFRKEALRICTTPFIVCTVDTVLGLMANAKTAIYGFPAIMNGLIVFDEIHAYDDVLFGHLLMFLKHFRKIPVLLMTASLQPERKKLLISVRPDLISVAGPEDLERVPRYNLEIGVAEDREIELILNALNQNQKVLYVCNRVESAISAYRRWKSRLTECGIDADIDLYHARYRYVDRVDLHMKVMDRFRDQSRPYLLIATQVAEISLDLSADLLVTEAAPIPAIIQRLGRLNRYVKPNESTIPRTAAVLRPDKSNDSWSLPYEKTEIESAEKWLNRLVNLRRPISQADLREALACEENAVDINAFLADAEDNAVFFSGGWKTVEQGVREGSYTVAMIREEDLRQFWNTHAQEPDQNWIRKHEIPMNVSENLIKVLSGWKRVRGVPVAPASYIRYEFDPVTKEGVGAEWAQK